MKLMSKLFKKNNNKGLSLVELICAIAILGLSTTAIGGAMVMSARHYQKDSAEFTIQQEAQLVTNQVGNLVVDAAEADWDNTNKKLTIKSDNKKHVIYQSGDKLLYEQYDNSNVKISDGVLAEGVAANGFAVDDSAFDSNKNVNISLTLDKDGRNIKADYNATSRNGKLADYEQAQQVAVISMEDVIVIEPQMTVANNKPYKAEIRVNGMTWEEVGGVILDSSTSVPNGFKVEIKPEGGKYYLFVEAEQNAGGSFPVYLKTVNTKADTNPLAEKQITVKVRRINNLSITGPASGNITLGNNGTEYVLTAEATGDNLTEGFGFKYDDAPYDYVNPRYVDFVVECPVDHEVVETGDVDNPSVKIKLKQTMTDGQLIKVTAYSKHAYQGNNKSGIAYDTSANVMKQYIIECDRPDLPNGVILPTDFERGEEYNWSMASHIKPGTWVGLSDHPAYDVQFRWFIRYQEDGGTWSKFTATDENGVEQKIDGDVESRSLLMDKTYKVQFVLAAINDANQMMWPHDETLLQQDGFKNVVTKGWDDATLKPEYKVTQENQYGGVYTLPAVEIAYKNKASDSADDKWGIPVYDATEPSTLVPSVGTSSTAVAFNTNESMKLNFELLYIYTDNENNVLLDPQVWELDESDVNNKKWVKVNFSDYFQKEFSQMTGGPQYSFKVKGGKENDVKGKTYRLGFAATTTSSKLKDSATLMNPEYETFAQTMKLYKDATDDSGIDLTDDTKGFIYFKFNN